MTKVTSLIPIPGSKRSKKYGFIRPLPFQKYICEPFMGGAAKSLQTGLRPILGEVNAGLREIALAPTRSDLAEYFVFCYKQTLKFMVEDLPLPLILSYAGKKQSQKLFRQEQPEIADELDFRWQLLTEDLFESFCGTEPDAGTYMFCLRACFGNVMRLSPKGTGFNVKWHVDKLNQALQFCPEVWCDALQQQQWYPELHPSWAEAILAVHKLHDTCLMIDPPYIEADEDRKMTPCYPGHRVTTSAKRETFSLACDSLELGMSRDFPLIYLCNYYSPQMAEAVASLAETYGYTVEKTEVGVCGALGNSNGRLEHGNRRDTRSRPIEVVWTLRSEF